MLGGNNAQVLIFQLKKTSMLLLHFPISQVLNRQLVLFFHPVINTDNNTENSCSFTADMRLKENLELYDIR